MARWALKVAYFGEKFFGSQIQAKARTVEGEMRKALVKLYGAEHIVLSSRTDRGVSALCNIVCYTGRKPILGQLNFALPKDITVWAYASVGEDFHCRAPTQRHYRYFLRDGGYLQSRVEKALEMFVGEKRLHNFVIGKPNDAVFLEQVRVSRRNGLFVIDFYAKMFLRSMIRKIVYATEAVASGAWNLDLLGHLFDEKFRRGVPSAPPEGLVLVDTKYAGVRFKSEKKWFDRFRKLASAKAGQAGVLNALSK